METIGAVSAQVEVDERSEGKNRVVGRAHFLFQIAEKVTILSIEEQDIQYVWPM